MPRTPSPVRSRLLKARASMLLSPTVTAALHRDDGISVGAFNDAVFASGGTGRPVSATSAGTDQDLGRHHRVRALLDPKPAHLWVAGYLEVEYSDNAKQLLVNRGAELVLAAGITLRTNATTCATRDWSMWRLASRTMWNPVENLDVGSRSCLHAGRHGVQWQRRLVSANQGGSGLSAAVPTPSTTTRTGLPRSACSATSGREPRLAVI